MDLASFDAQLVSLVERYENIYNKTANGYKDERTKVDSWTAIAEELNTEVEFVKRRWDNLRDRFVRARKDMMGKASSGRAIKVSFPYHDIMQWLVPYIRRRRFLPSFKPEGISRDALKDVVEDKDTPPPAVGATATAKSGPSRGDSPFPEKRRRGSAEALALEARSAGEIATAGERTVDEADLFFMKSVALDMQCIPKRKRVQFKMEVLQLLNKYTYVEEGEES